MPRLLLLDEPTRGVDVGAKAEIHDALAVAASGGAGVVISSSDLPELLRTCDRIVVMAQGRVAGSLSAGDATEEGLMALATGVHADAGPTHLPKGITREPDRRPPFGSRARRDHPIAARRNRLQGIARRVLFQREIGVVTALVVLCAYGTFGTDGFAAKTNLLNVGQQVSLIGIMAIGMTFVIVSGEIDLSVGSTYALASTVTGLLLSHGHNWITAVIAGVLAGAGCGLVNGLVTVGLGLPSFIVTLGTLSIFRGVALLATNAAPITLDQSVGNISSFSYLGEGRPLGIPMQLIIMLGLVAVGGFLLRYMRFGFRIYAVGGSREAARLWVSPLRRCGSRRS